MATSKEFIEYISEELNNTMKLDIVKCLENI